ncbi:hypothetical protein NIES3275_52390 [Microchaete diplosiphon NIES-3275]|nr:hypothetical protein NIES3275_52390 [Microchaete diplosiphon NIES-3275]
MNILSFYTNLKKECDRLYGQGIVQRCQLNVKPAWLEGFALTPSPSPTGRREPEI